MSVSMDIRPGGRGPFDMRPNNALDPIPMGGIIIETTDYEKLKNKPSINGVELVGNKTAEDLGITGGGTKYAFAEGNEDGAFSVTPTGGQPQSVKVHGLQAHCFGALTEEEVLYILNYNEDAEETAEAPGA